MNVRNTFATAISNKQHDEIENGDIVTHLATALNIKDLYNEVVKRCPVGIAILLVQWLRWQFWPRHAG